MRSRPPRYSPLPILHSHPFSPPRPYLFFGPLYPPQWESLCIMQRCPGGRCFRFAGPSPRTRAGAADPPLGRTHSAAVHTAAHRRIGKARTSHERASGVSPLSFSSSAVGSCVSSAAGSCLPASSPCLCYFNYGPEWPEGAGADCLIIRNQEKPCGRPSPIAPDPAVGWEPS